MFPVDVAVGAELFQLFRARSAIVMICRRIPVEKAMRIGLRCVLGFIVAMSLASAPAWAAPREQLVIGTTQFPSTLHPSIDSMLAKSFVLGFTERPFTAYDADWRLICLLCTELPTLENGKAAIEDLPPEVIAQAEERHVCKTADPALARKGIAVTYTIQPQATWGDGTPVTTADVLFTYEVGRNEKSGISNSELYRRILRVDAIDDKTFTLHFDRLDFVYNAINDFRLLPAHLERAAFAEPAEYPNRTLYNTDPTNPGLWFGPYKVTSIEPGAQIVLDANPTWWGQPPAIKRIVVKTIENSSALEANLLSGAIDYIAGEVGLTLDQALAFEQRHGADFDITYKPVLFYEHLTPNLDNPALADRRVRRALLRALDRRLLTEKLFAGKQQVAHTSINPLDWIHTDDVRKYDYDPAQAAALLDEAGWPLGADGLRRNEAGEALSLELVSTAGDRTRELVQQVLQSQWKAVGIEVRIKNEPARVLFGQTINQRQFTGLALFAWLSSPENVPRTSLHSSMVPTADNGWSGQNYANFRDRELDDLMDCIEIELDRDKRGKMWHRLQEIYAEELPDLPLYFRSQAYILPKWLRGITPTGHQNQSSLWAETWRIEE
jgi:peptide/nickel transport system substrate-binding protein